MEIRRFHRVIVSLDAELVANGISHTGFIGNLSEDGIYMKMTNPGKSIMDISNDLPVLLQFQLPSGDPVTLQCTVKWINRQPSNDCIRSVGMEIIEAPEVYRDFLLGRVRV